MKRIIGLLLAIASIVILPAAAQATSQAISVPNGVLWDGCRDHPFALVISAPGAANGFSADVTIYDAHGDVSDSDFVYSDYPVNGQTAFRGAAHLCDWEPPGTWRITAEITYYDESYSSWTQTVSRTFTMRDPFSRTQAQSTDYTANYGQWITLRSKVTVEKPNGSYVACAYCYTVIHRWTAGGWRVVASGQTNQYGYLNKPFRWDLRGSEARVYRAVTPATADYRASISPNMKVY